MTLVRDHVLLLGPQPRQFDGRRTRNVELQPCGCWSGEVWRDAPTGRRDKKTGKIELSAQWCQDKHACPTHSAAVAVLSLKLSERINGAASLAQIGDGAKRLLADSTRILAEAEALNQELASLCCGAPRLPRRQLSPKDQLHWSLPTPEKTGQHDE